MAISKRQLKHFKSSIKTLEAWVCTKGWDVNFQYYAKDELLPTEKEITINKKNSIENQLYSLIHECGHLVIRMNQKRYASKYPIQHQAYKKDYNRNFLKSTAYKVDVIAEEYGAWKKGKVLAEKFGIKVNEKNFTKVMSDSIFTYIESAAE